MSAVDAELFLQATLCHLDALHALARRLVATDAEDLVQQTWVKAFAAWTEPPPRDVRAWLATICLNTARNRYRSAANRPEVLLADPGRDLPATGSDTDPAATAITRGRAAAVHAALWTLPEAQRVAITLMDLAGFTAREVAELTGAPRGTVLARVHRGRKALATVLAAHAPEPAPVRPAPPGGGSGD